jgi:periplasmic protein TonB
LEPDVSSNISVGYKAVPKGRRRNIGLRRLVGISIRPCFLNEMLGEQSKKHGVYIDVFEQSILIHDRPAKSWGFLASASAELAIVSFAILIPLARTDHLPGFHWKSVSLGAPSKPLEPAPVVAQTAGSATYLVARRAFIPLPNQSSLSNHGASTEFVSIDPPGAIAVDGPARSGGIAIEKLAAMPLVPRPPHPPDAAAAPSAPIRVGGDVQMAKLVRKVIPEYPALAKTARVSGVVHLLGIIGKDGTIQNLQLISGHPLLAHAALEAVKQWIYQPTLLNGQPVEVIAPIDVNFTLGR